MTTRDHIINLREAADKAAEDYLQCKGEYHPDYHEVADEYFYLAAQREAYERAAITAWNHFMDRCNYSNCHPADEGPWCAATAIRKLKEES